MSDSAKSEPEMIECKVWVIVNAAGEYTVGTTADEVGERWTDDESGFQNSLPQRVACIKLRLPKPLDVEATVELPAEPTDGVSVKVA